jgi:hypothetical protein
MLVNLTPHAIVVQKEGVETTIPPSGQAARCVVKTVLMNHLGLAETVGGFPLSRQEFGAVEGLPEPKAGVWYITSTIVAQRAKRPDVVSPDTGPTAIRENGQVKAVLGFQSFA